MSYEQNTDFIKTRFVESFKSWFYDEKWIPRHEKRVPGPARTLPDPEKLGKLAENLENDKKSTIFFWGPGWTSHENEPNDRVFWIDFGVLLTELLQKIYVESWG